MWLLKVKQKQFLKEKSIPRTTGAKESHKVMGIDCPRMNWEAAALKNGSRAIHQKQKKLQRISSLMLSFKNSFTCLLVMCSTFDCVGEWDSNSCKGHITGHMTKSMTYSHRNKKLQKVWVHGLHKSQQTKISTLPIYVQGYESRGSYFNPYNIVINK